MHVRVMRLHRLICHLDLNRVARDAKVGDSPLIFGGMQVFSYIIEDLDVLW